MPFNPTLPANNSPLSSAEMRAQLTALKALVDAQGPVYGRLAADWTNSTTTFSDVTGLSFPVAAGESWTAEFVLHTISSSGGQGLKFRVSGPGASSLVIVIAGTGTSGSTAYECEVQTAFNVLSPAKSFCVGANLTGAVRVHLVATNVTSSNILQLQAASTANGSAVTIKANSDLVAHKTG